MSNFCEKKWSEFLFAAVEAYNNCEHRATKFSPNRLWGKKVFFKVDLDYNIKENICEDINKVEDLARENLIKYWESYQVSNVLISMKLGMLFIISIISQIKESKGIKLSEIPVTYLFLYTILHFFPKMNC